MPSIGPTSTSAGSLPMAGPFASCRSSSMAASVESATDKVTGGCWYIGGAYYLYRSWFAFDTSAVPDDATIDSVTLTATPTSTSSGHQMVCVQPSPSSLVVASYNISNFGSSAKATFPNSTTADTAQTVTITSPTINKNGVTYIGLRGKPDVDNSAPGTTTGTTYWYSGIGAEVSKRATLTVNYTPASSTVLLNLLKTRYYNPSFIGGM